MLLFAATADFARGDERAVDPQRLRAAIEGGLEEVRRGAANYVKNRDCFSCHHQALPLVTMARARRAGLDGTAGLPVSGPAIDAQVEFTLAWYRPKRDQLKQGRGAPSGAIEAGYAAWALAETVEADDPNNVQEVLDSLRDFLLVRQEESGRWTAVHRRPPMETAGLTGTATALVALARPDGESHGTLEWLVVRQGAAWLRRAEPESTEDAAMQMWGLFYAGLDDDELVPYRDRLLALQRSDGGWGQLPESQSDAYATGQALFLLAECGLPTDSDAYARGVAFLLRDQQQDGSWYVATRSRPLRVFFDNGDPGGKSQFISFAATNWATLALLQALPPSGSSSPTRVRE